MSEDSFREKDIKKCSFRDMTSRAECLNAQAQLFNAGGGQWYWKVPELCLEVFMDQTWAHICDACAPDLCASPIDLGETY